MAVDGDDQEFVIGRSLRFAGGSFEEQGFSLAKAKELSAFQRIVVAAAVRRYLDENPDRARAPRSRIEASVQLAFLEVGTGSKTIPLLWADAALGQQDLLSEDDLWGAVDEAFEMIACAASCEDLEILNPESREAVKAFGATFRGEERLEFQRHNEPMIYGVTERVRFLGALKGSEVVQSTLIGWVKMLDVEGRFELVTPTDGRISGSFEDSSVFRDLHDAQTTEVEDRPLVWLDCAWQRDLATHRPLSIIRVDDAGRFVSADAPRISRLASLASLSDGWMEGEGERLSIVALERTASVLTRLSDAELESPSVFPHPSGAVSLQWVRPDGHFAATIAGEGPLDLRFTPRDGSPSTVERLSSEEALILRLREVIGDG